MIRVRVGYWWGAVACGSGSGFRQRWDGDARISRPLTELASPVTKPWLNCFNVFHAWARQQDAVVLAGVRVLGQDAKPVRWRPRGRPRRRRNERGRDWGQFLSLGRPLVLDWYIWVCS